MAGRKIDLPKGNTKAQALGLGLRVLSGGGRPASRGRPYTPGPIEADRATIDRINKHLDKKFGRKPKKGK